MTFYRFLLQLWLPAFLVLTFPLTAQPAEPLPCPAQDGDVARLPPDGNVLNISPLLRVAPDVAAFETAVRALEAYRACEFGNQNPDGQAFEQGPLWLAFELGAAGQPSDDLLILQVGPGSLDRVTAYLATPHGAVRELGAAGDQVPRGDAEVPYFKPTFTLRPPATEGYSVLLRIDNQGGHATSVRLIRGSAFAGVAALQGLLLGTLLSVGLLILLMTAWLYVLQRRALYVLWFAYVGLLSAALLFNNGVVYHQFPAVPLAWLNPLSEALSLLSVAAGGAFLAALFGLRERRRWYRGFLVWLALVVILATAAGFAPAWVGLAALPLIAAAVIAAMAALGRLMCQRHPMALVLGLPLQLYLGATLYYLFANAGLVGLPGSLYWFWDVAGMINLLLIQGVLLLQALADQRNSRQEYRQLTQLLTDKNQALEDRIRARTRDLETALRDVQKAEAEQRQLLSMASHEFRTPAAMIKMSLDSLRYLPDPIPPLVNARLDNIRLASQRLTLLTNSLIVDNRLREPRLQIHPAILSLDQTIRDVAAGYPASTPLRLDLPPAPVMLDADAALLSIALHNLIDNALHHGASSRPGIVISLAERDGHVTLAVGDNGPGIPDAEKEKVFERFERRHASRGSGLGLSIVRAIVRAHGGSIQASDNEPLGTRMVIQLPRQR
ncbi:MAG: ATP-binding protein [Pigmentiphaga sp.]